MIIYYFHGWGGHFDETKHKILAKFGDEVYYPNIDYENQRSLINHYVNEVYSAINSGNPVLLVGTSMGGYLAHHIANIVSCPALLINPAFFFKVGAEMRPQPGANGPENMQKQFVFSMKDEVLDVKRCIKYVKEFKHEETNIKCYDSLTHQIPIDIFEQEFSDFREKYKTFKFNLPDDGSSKAKKLRMKERYGTVGREPVERVERAIRPDEPVEALFWDEPPRPAQVRFTYGNPVAVADDGGPQQAG